MEKPWHDDGRVRRVRDNLANRPEAHAPGGSDEGRDGGSPLYTLILHGIRKELGLTLAEYAVIDTIGVLSNNRSYPWCRKSKERIADDLEVSRSTVFRAVAKGLKQGLVEKGTRQGELRTTQLWLDTVTLERSRLKKKRSV